MFDLYAADTHCRPRGRCAEPDRLPCGATPCDEVPRIDQPRPPARHRVDKYPSPALEDGEAAFLPRPVVDRTGGHEMHCPFGRTCRRRCFCRRDQNELCERIEPGEGLVHGDMLLRLRGGDEGQREARRISHSTVILLNGPGPKRSET